MECRIKAEFWGNRKVISVIILAYNGEKYIRKCLDSVINQTIGLEHIEIIVIDDVSSDSTVEILKEYEKKYSDNICLILRDVNSMKTGEVNRNLGVQYANGEYILFLDQDDWYEPDAFERLLAILKQYQDIDYIEYAFNYTDVDGIAYKHSKFLKTELLIFDILAEETRTSLAIEGVLPGATFVWNKIYRKDFLEKNFIYHNDGEIRTGFSDNFFSGLVVLSAKKMARLSVPLYNYRNYVGSYSHDTKKNSKVQLERCKVAVVLYDECVKRGFAETKWEMVEYIFARTFLLKTFWKFLLQFDPIPYEILAFIQQEMKIRCPEYKENSIMRNKKDMQMVLEILEKEWTPEFLETLALQVNEIQESCNLKKYMYLI